MKKLSLMLGLGALVLASCTNDEQVVAPTVENAGSAIGFAVTKGNLSRSPLSDEQWSFGVWAYKGASEPTSVIMEKYLVGYWNGTKGYKPLAGQATAGSWYYEGLGSTQVGAWTDADGSHPASYAYEPKDVELGMTSSNEVQYLKYWDRAATNNWFYAYTPYNLNVTYNNTAHTLTFPTISSTDGSCKGTMYASKMVVTPTGAENTKVNLEFSRLFAQIRFAFYEVVDGYQVELIDYKTGYEDVYVVPSQKDGTDYNPGTYVTSAAPVITFGAPNYTGASVNYNNAPKTDTTINLPRSFYHKNDPGAVITDTLGTTYANAIINDSKDVLPQANDSECGFTVNLSLKFTALDTHEVIYINGVRAHIPATACRWQANHIYTYYFKVTKAVPGIPGTPDDPGPTPGSDPNLLPIVFDQVTVTDMTSHEETIEVNPLVP